MVGTQISKTTLMDKHVLMFNYLQQERRVKIAKEGATSSSNGNNSEQKDNKMKNWIKYYIRLFYK